jgi:hypothetical protein
MDLNTINRGGDQISTLGPQRTSAIMSYNGSGKQIVSSTFLDGTRTTAEERSMLGMLVRDCSYVLLISLNGLFKLDYRKKVLANQAAMTPFL